MLLGLAERGEAWPSREESRAGPIQRLFQRLSEDASDSMGEDDEAGASLEGDGEGFKGVESVQISWQMRFLPPFLARYMVASAWLNALSKESGGLRKVAPPMEKVTEQE